MTVAEKIGDPGIAASTVQQVPEEITLVPTAVPEGRTTNLVSPLSQQDLTLKIVPVLLVGVTVFVGVTVLVIVGVTVTVAVMVFVGVIVGVGDGQG